jgi:hypothetical protein
MLMLLMLNAAITGVQRADEVGRIVMRRMLSFATGRVVHMKLGYRANVDHPSHHDAPYVLCVKKRLMTCFRHFE